MLLSRTETLVERAKNGDRAAFDALAARYQARLEALVMTRFGYHLEAEMEAEDVIQETLLKALQSIQRFNWRGEDSFMRWLGTIAENVIRSAARRKERRHAVPLQTEIADSDVSQSTNLRRHERFDRFQEAIDSLDPDSRKVVYLARIKGLPMKEVAQQLGRTPNAASILLYRALIKLKAVFGDTESLGLPPLRLKEKGDPS